MCSKNKIYNKANLLKGWETTNKETRFHFKALNTGAGEPKTLHFTDHLGVQKQCVLGEDEPVTVNFSKRKHKRCSAIGLRIFTFLF